MMALLTARLDNPMQITLDKTVHHLMDSTGADMRHRGYLELTDQIDILLDANGKGME